MSQKTTVLFVDDEPSLLEGIKLTLRKEPYDIVTASSAAAALDILAQRPVEVVVSDEKMPGMSGAAFLAEVCKRHPETIRIMLTGEASAESAIRAINEGEVYRFLSKPCSPVHLANTIRDAIVIRRLTRESRRLLATVRDQHRVLETLESKHPGITHVDRGSDGSFVIDDDEMDLADLIKQMADAPDRTRPRQPKDERKAA